MTLEQINEIIKHVKWGRDTGQYKNLDELIDECEQNLKVLGGGGFYGVKFTELIPFLKAENETNYYGLKLYKRENDE